MAQGERTDTLSEGMNSALPCQLYVLNKDTGELAGEEFSKEVESCKVDTNPSEGSQKMEYVEPVYNEVSQMQRMFLISIMYLTVERMISSGHLP